MIASILAKITAAPDNVKPADWAEKYVKAVPYSPKSGELKLSPIQRAVFEAIVARKTRCVSIVASVQSGKTLSSELALAWLIVNAPGPAIWLDLTDESAKDQSEGRLKPLFENVPPVKSLFNPDKNKMRKSTMIFTNGMTIWSAGARNKRNLQRRSIKYVFGDETWLWEPGRMAEAEARTTAFQGGRCVFLSQAGFVGDDTDKKFNASSAAEWNFRCPECGRLFAPKLEDLRFEETRTPDGKTDYAAAAESARLVCPHCRHAFAFSKKTLDDLNENGKFVPANPNAPKDRIGFRWNAFASMDWAELAVMFLHAKDAANRGDVSDLKAFYQKRLALPWDNGDSAAESLVEAVVPEGDFLLRQKWSDEADFDAAAALVVPGGKGTHPLRFLTVDVQQTHCFWVVRSWSERGDSRLLDCGVAVSFDEIKKTAERYDVFPVFVGIDCGYNPEAVFRFCAENNFTALRGSPKNEWTFDRAGKMRRPFSPRELIDCGNGKAARRHFFSNLRIKDVLHAIRSGTTEIAWEIPRDAPANYLRMLNSERRNDEKQIWEQINSRANHFFDCETMNIATAIMLGIVG